MGKKVWVKHRKYLTPKYARPYCLARYWLEVLRMCLSRNLRIDELFISQEFENLRIQDLSFPKLLGNIDEIFWIWRLEIRPFEFIEILRFLVMKYLRYLVTITIANWPKNRGNSNVTRWDFVKLYLCAELLATQRPFSSNLASLFLARHSEKKKCFCKYMVRVY